MRDDLHRFLLDAGASEDDIERARREGWLPLLALDRLVMPGRRIHTLGEVAALADVDADHVRRLWRAVGFPDAPEDLAVFTDADVEAARIALHGRFAERAGLETILRQARVIGSSMARVASVLAEALGDDIRSYRERGLDEEDVAWTTVDNFATDETSALLLYVTQLQLRAALWRWVSRDAVPDLAVAIGFADLAGYTELSSELDADELAAFVGRWEEVAYDTVAQHGGRVVKTIGDEVMFAGLTAPVARTAVALRDAAGRHGLPPVRIGLAAGMVVAHDGDLYGPVVNLASRLTDVAPAGTIYASDALHADLASDASFAWEPLGRRDLRSIGSVEVFSLLGTQ